MPLRQSSMTDRSIEYDSLALVMFALGFLAVFACVAGLTATWSPVSPGLFVAAALVGLGAVAGWIIGYPRYAALPCIGLVLLAATIVLPRLFPAGGALMPDLGATNGVRFHVIRGLYVGGLGVAVLGFLVACFIGPLIGASLRALRREKQARTTLLIHLALTAAAFAFIILTQILL
jgi:hypothetical protein